MKFLALPKGIPLGNFTITFYSICILVGALCALFIGMYRIKKIGYTPSRLETVFLIAFPMGLIGARIWYIICQWASFKAVFEISFWEGFGNLFGITSQGIRISGLAIEGGVLLGIISGMIFVHKRRKEMKVFDISDVVVPGILLAQAIGRWGNFFNQEVYGLSVDPEPWRWLGQWFIDQMTVGGEFKNPLFFIESLFNILGFGVLTALSIKPIKKFLHLAPGTVTFSYFVWYGTVRALLEPLRDPTYIMTNYISVTMSWIFVGIGVVGIALCYLYKYFFRKKFKLHWFDKRITPHVYKEYCSDNYIDDDFNIVERKKVDEEKLASKKVKMPKNVDKEKPQINEVNESNNDEDVSK